MFRGGERSTQQVIGHDRETATLLKTLRVFPYLVASRFRAASMPPLGFSCGLTKIA